MTDRCKNCSAVLSQSHEGDPIVLKSLSYSANNAGSSQNEIIPEWATHGCCSWECLKYLKLREKYSGVSLPNGAFITIDELEARMESRKDSKGTKE